MSVGELPPMRRMVTRVVFQGDKHNILPQIVYESRCQGQFGGLASKPYPGGRGETGLKSTTSSL